MEAWEMEMANMLNRGKRKPSTAAFVIGKVIQPLPNISISAGDDILLDKEDLIIANQLYLKHIHQPNEFNTSINQPLAAGDEVILLPDENGQRYALLDKVGE